MKAMHISVYPAGGGRYYSRVRRQDGVVLHLPGYDRKWSVPHDLAHFAAERAFGWTGGLWGSIAAGAELPNMHVISGRPRHDHKARSDAILRANSADLGIAEALAGLVHELTESAAVPVFGSLSRAWGTLRTGPCPFTSDQLEQAVADLRELRTRWQALAPGEHLDLHWPWPATRNRRQRQPSRR